MSNMRDCASVIGTVRTMANSVFPQMNDGVLQCNRLVTLRPCKSFVVEQKFGFGFPVEQVPIRWVGDDFKKDFYGLHEALPSEVSVYECELIKKSFDKDIHSALCGKEVQLSLGIFWEYLKTAHQIFSYGAYVRNKYGDLRVVHARFQRGGLRVNSSKLHRSVGWLAHRRFIISAS